MDEYLYCKQTGKQYSKPVNTTNDLFTLVLFTTPETGHEWNWYPKYKLDYNCTLYYGTQV